MLLEQLSQHKLDMILSDCPVDSSQQEGLFSLKLGECGISFFCRQPAPDLPFPACLEQRKLLIPGRRSMLGASCSTGSIRRAFRWKFWASSTMRR